MQIFIRWLHLDLISKILVRICKDFNAANFLTGKVSLLDNFALIKILHFFNCMKDWNICTTFMTTLGENICSQPNA